MQRKKERGQTNGEFLERVFEEVKDFDQICIAVQYPSGSVDTFFSQAGSFPLIGMLEVAKQQVFTDMQS